MGPLFPNTTSTIGPAPPYVAPMSSLCKIDPSIFSLTHSHFFPSPLSSQRLSLAGLDRTKAPPLPSSAGADALPLGRRGQAKASTGGDPTCEQRDAKVWQRQFAVPPWMCSSSVEACSWTEMYGDGLWPMGFGLDSKFVRVSGIQVSI